MKCRKCEKEITTENAVIIPGHQGQCTDCIDAYIKSQEPLSGSLQTPVSDAGERKILKPIEITAMLGVAIDELYKHEVLDCEMQDLIEESEKEWKENKFDELFETAIERIEYLQRNKASLSN